MALARRPRAVLSSRSWSSMSERSRRLFWTMIIAAPRTISPSRTLSVMSTRAGLEAQLHSEYRSLVAALGPWRQVFDLRDTPSQIKTRGPAESAIFRSGDVTLYRFGPTIVVQRRLSGWT